MLTPVEHTEVPTLDILNEAEQQIYQGIQIDERLRLDVATLRYLTHFTRTETEMEQLAYLDVVYQAGELQQPTSAAMQSEEFDYSAFTDHLRDAAVWEKLSPYLEAQELARPQSEDPRELYDFLFTTVASSFSERLHNIYGIVRLERKIARYCLRLDLSPRDLAIYRRGYEQKRQEQHLVAEYTAHACTPISELNAQLKQSEAREDI